MHGIWMAIARLAGFDWLAPRWWPYWGGGAPLEYTYPPLVPVTVAAVSRAFHGSLSLAFHQVTGFVYCFGPLAFYLASWRLFRAPGYSFAAALTYSLLSPTELIVPDYAFHFSSLRSARRMMLAFDWDEVPHLTSLMLMPLAAWLLARALQTRKRLYYALCGASMALMILANMFGGILAAVVAVTLPVAMERHFQPSLLLRSAAVFAAVCLIVSPWLPPSLVYTVYYIGRMNGEGGLSLYSLGALAGVLVLSAIVWRLCSRYIRDWPMRWVLVCTCPAVLVPVLAQYTGVHFLPQPGRYKIEMEAALVWAAVFALRSWIERVPWRARLALLIPLLVIAERQVVSHRRYAKLLTRSVDVASSIEYRTAKWAEAHFPRERVMLGGSLGQWLNTFTDVPQLGGQNYTTALNWQQQLAVYAITAGQNAGERDAECSLLWLKAFGVQVIGVPGPQSPEYWKPFHNPRKFDGVLPVLWREDDTTMYRVSNSGSLAHVVRPEQLVQHQPANGLDVEELRRFAAALEDPAAPAATLEWSGTNRFAVHARLAAGQVISVQVNYHPGWRARVNGAFRQIRPDGMGLITVHPGCAGDCQITFEYDGGVEAKLCRAVSAATGLWLLLAAIPRRRALRSGASEPR